jgi:hypothetical protein
MDAISWHELERREICEGTLVGEEASSLVSEVMQEPESRSSLHSLMLMFGQRLRADPDLDRPDWRPQCEVPVPGKEKMSSFVNGTVARDFRPLVINQSHLGH